MAESGKDAEYMPCCGFGLWTSFRLLCGTINTESLQSGNVEGVLSLEIKQASNDGWQKSEKLCGGDSSPQFCDYRITDCRRCLCSDPWVFVRQFSYPVLGPHVTHRGIERNKRTRVTRKPCVWAWVWGKQVKNGILAKKIQNFHGDVPTFPSLP